MQFNVQMRDKSVYLYYVVIFIFELFLFAGFFSIIL